MDARESSSDPRARRALYLRMLPYLSERHRLAVEERVSRRGLRPDTALAGHAIGGPRAAFLWLVPRMTREDDEPSQYLPSRWLADEVEMRAYAEERDLRGV